MINAQNQFIRGFFNSNQFINSFKKYLEAYYILMYRNSIKGYMQKLTEQCIFNIKLRNSMSTIAKEDKSLIFPEWTHQL